MRTRAGSVFFALVSLVAAVAIAGNSEFIPMGNARVIARNGLHLAGSRGATAALWNPAGLGLLGGRGLELSVIDRREQQQYESPARGFHCSFRQDDFAFGGGAFWVGLGPFVPALSYGRVVDYAVNWPYAMVRSKGAATTLLAFDMFHRFHVNALSLACAFALGGAHLGIAAHNFWIERSVAFPLANESWYQGQGAPAYQVAFDQQGKDYGWSLGAIVPVGKHVRAGIMVRSGYSTSLHGKARSGMVADLDSVAARETEVTSRVQMPWSVAAGLNLELGGEWEVNIDGAYSLWGTTEKALSFSFQDPRWRAVLSGIDTVTGVSPGQWQLDLRNSVDLGFGVEYAPPRSFTYELGYRFAGSPNSAASYSMFLPTVDHHWLSLGVCYTGVQYCIEAALTYGFGERTHVRASENAGFNGKYDADALVLGFTVRYGL